MNRRYSVHHTRLFVAFYIAMLLALGLTGIVLLAAGEYYAGSGLAAFFAIGVAFSFPYYVELGDAELRMRTGLVYNWRIPLTTIDRVTPDRRFGGFSFGRAEGLTIVYRGRNRFAPVSDPEGLRQAILDAAPHLHRYGDELRSAP